MRWKYPRHEDRRTRSVFAWFPISCRGTTYWLERVTLREVYLGYAGCWCLEALQAEKDADK